MAADRPAAPPGTVGAAEGPAVPLEGPPLHCGPPLDHATARLAAAAEAGILVTFGE